MRKVVCHLVMALAILPPALARAQPGVSEAGLPTKIDVVSALDAAPSVRAALARADAARAEAQVLSRGPHEFTLSTTYASRTVNDGTGVANGRFDEFSAEVTRPFRLPGKATLDRQIGQQGVTYASNMAEDARHQAALMLAQDWWDWMGATQEAKVDAQAVENARALLSSVKRRVALRDASQLEEDQASAATGAAAAQASRSAGRVAVARARLVAQFPALPLPAAAPDAPVPSPPPGGFMMLHDRILGESHELAAARALARQTQAQADRARKERTGDPTFGLRVFSEKGGMEKGGGVVFSMPFGGGFRSAQADRASAQATAAQADLQAVQLTINETADTDLENAQAGLAAWGDARAALDAQMATLLKTRRGQQLGEIGLAEVLLAERMMHDAFRAEAIARIDALRAITKLRIDSHQLWIGDDEGEPAQNGGRSAGPPAGGMRE